MQVDSIWVNRWKRSGHYPKMLRTVGVFREKESIAEAQHFLDGYAKKRVNKIDLVQVIFNLVDLFDGFVSCQEN